MSQVRFNGFFIDHCHILVDRKERESDTVYAQDEVKKFVYDHGGRSFKTQSQAEAGTSKEDEKRKGQSKAGTSKRGKKQSGLKRGCA